MKQIFAIIAVALVVLLIVIKMGVFSRTVSLDGISPDGATPGELITLTGIGLDSNPSQTLVFFNHLNVVPEKVVSNGIAVRVPQGATSGLVYAVVGNEKTNEKFFQINSANGAMPAGHPDIKQMGSMQQQNAGMQQEQPGMAAKAGNPMASGSNAHEFYDADKAKEFMDFELPDEAGKKVKLSDFKGEVVLLHFWATWCKPCMQEVPSLERLTGRSDSMGLKVLAVSVDNSFEDIKKTMPDIKLNVLLDSERKVATKYGTLKFPETWVIDKNGKIVARFIGSRNWDSPTFVRFFSILLKNGTVPSGMGK